MLIDDLPAYVHFFSWVTRVSLELPVGFEEAMEDLDANRAIYADDLDEDDDLGARVITMTTAVGDDDARTRMARGSAEWDVRQCSSRTEGEIDGLPVVQQVLHYHEPRIGVDLVRHETYAQAGDVVLSIVCAAPAAAADDYLPEFEHAASTARFVLL